MSASGTDDTSWIKESEEFKELVERLWEKWKGMKITLDARKRANKVAFTNFLARLVAAAYEAGIEDPLKVIDWEHVLDPGLSQAENAHIVEEQYHIRVEGGRRRRSELPPMAEDRELLLREEIRSTENFIRDLDFEIRYGEDIYGNKLTPEQIESARRQKEELEKQLEELRRELEEIEKKKPPPAPERRRGAPRRRARPAEERAPPPAPPAPAPAPAPPAPAAPTPEEERERLWEAFSIALVSAGLDPAEFREDFEGVYRAAANRPYAEKFNAVMRIASGIVREHMPRVPVALREALEAMREELRKGLEQIAQGLNRPVTPQEYLTAAEAELASVPPEESVERVPVSAVRQTPQECGGHTHVWIPNADALGLMRTYGVSTVIIRKFHTCPERWRYEVDGNADLEYTVAVMEEVGEVPPFFARWLMELAKVIDDMYEKEGRLEGIARYRDLRKRLGGRFTAVGK